MARKALLNLSGISVITLPLISAIACGPSAYQEVNLNTPAGLALKANLEYDPLEKNPKMLNYFDKVTKLKVYNVKLKEAKFKNGFWVEGLKQGKSLEIIVVEERNFNPKHKYWKFQGEVTGLGTLDFVTTKNVPEFSAIKQKIYNLGHKLSQTIIKHGHENIFKNLLSKEYLQLMEKQII